MSAADGAPAELETEQKSEQERQAEQGELEVPADMEVEEGLTPNNSPDRQDLVEDVEDTDYEETINLLERRVAQLGNRLAEASRAKTVNDTEVSQLRTELQASHDRQRQNVLDLAQLKARLDASHEVEKKFQKLVDEMSKRLQAFEDQQSVQQLQLKLQQSNKKVQYLQLQLQNCKLGSSQSAPSLTISAEEQVTNLRTIESLKCSLSAKEVQRNLLLKKIAQFNEQVESFNEKIRLQLEKSDQAEAYTRLLSERLKEEISLRERNEVVVRQLREALSRRESEVGVLSAKLDSQIKRKIDNEHSNHLQEKQELLKDYIDLEKRYSILQEKLEFQTEKTSKLQMSLLTAKQGTVNKDQYDTLAKRYVHIKNCLESSMKKLAVAQGSPANTSMPFSQENRETELGASRLVLQTQVKQLETYRTLYEQTVQLQRNPEQVIELTKLRQLVERQKKQVEQADHCVKVYEGELGMKEQLLNDFMKKCFEYSRELDSLQREHNILTREVDQLRADKDINAIRLKSSEARYMELLKYLGEVQSQSTNWRVAYEKAKEAMVLEEETRRPAEHFSFEKPVEPRIEVRVVEAHALKFPRQQSAQTDSSEFHLNELKHLLSQGKEFVKKIAQLMEPIDVLKKELEKTKHDYSGLLDGIKVSKQELVSERNELQGWKRQTRDQLERQIRQDFVELRELLDNQRLLSALKKAKYLIQEYDAQEQQAPEQAQEQAQAQQGQPADAAVEQPEDEALKL